MEIVATWQMWATMVIVAVAVYLYFREQFTIESISVGIIVALLLFFHFFGGDAGLDSKSLLSGFAAPALITIMALLVVGQGLFHTGALEGPVMKINGALDVHPRRTLALIFAIAFSISMFMNNTPVVVMFIPVLTAMASRLRKEASLYMMPLSFICILAGMTTLIGSSTNLLVNDVYQRVSGESLQFFTQFAPGIALAIVGAIYIIIFAPILLPKREGMEQEITDAGRQYIAQIGITKNHPLAGVKPIAGLFPPLKTVTVRMIQRGEKSMLPPFEEPLQPDDILVVAATRSALHNLLTSDKKYLEGMLSIAGFDNKLRSQSGAESLVISEAVIAPGSRMVGRNIEQIGFRRETGCLVLGIQRRSRMIRARMLDIRLEAGDILLIFGYEANMQSLRSNRDLVLLDWSTTELPDIRRSRAARFIFCATVLAAAINFVLIEIAAMAGAIAMIAAGCLNVRQAVRALDMRIFLLIGAAFAMGLALENTGGAAYMAMKTVELFAPFGNHVLLAALFLIIAIMTNLISNSATALLFAPIALSISEQTNIDPMVMVLTVIFAANCSFATPIAYQTNLLVMGPGHYKFSDFARFGVPLMLVIWIAYTIMLPLFFNV